jgi:4-hydroxy-3-methylbut-2-enyl diphosphate reductase
MAYAASVDNREYQRVFTMGPLIHNPQTMEELHRRGVEALAEDTLPENLQNSLVIIRAHGVTPRLEGDLRARGAQLLDATCPKVKASQMKTQSLNQAGYHIFLAGEKHHAEVQGIQGYAPDCIIVGNREEAEAAASRLHGADCLQANCLQANCLLANLQESAASKTALIAQTTISPEEYQAIGEGIGVFFPDLEIIDTICGATRDRQEALRKLCTQVEAVIIAGGRESANTRRLLAIAQAAGKPAWLVESAKELPPEIRRYSLVGLCSGASTPNAIIDEIEKRCQAT